MPRRVDEYESLLTNNDLAAAHPGRRAMIRRAGEAYGMTGPSLRATGVEHDLRKARPYSGYENYDFEIPTGTEGDIYDRYLVRMEEMRQSVRILEQALDNLPDGPVNIDDPKIFLPPKKRVLTSMEELIHQFMIVTEGFECPAGEVYHSTEVPKGELGFYIVSTGGRSPYRLRIRSPSFNNIADPAAPGRGRADRGRRRQHRQPRSRDGRGRPLSGGREKSRSMFGAEFEEEGRRDRRALPGAEGGAAARVLWEVQKATRAGSIPRPRPGSPSGWASARRTSTAP